MSPSRSSDAPAMLLSVATTVAWVTCTPRGPGWTMRFATSRTVPEASVIATAASLPPRASTQWSTSPCARTRPTLAMRVSLNSLSRSSSSAPRKPTAPYSASDTDARFTMSFAARAADLDGPPAGAAQDGAAHLERAAFDLHRHASPPGADGEHLAVEERHLGVARDQRRLGELAEGNPL